MAKADKQTVRQRVDAVEKILLMCGEPAAVTRHAESQGWNVCDRQLRRYIARANKRLEKRSEPKRKRILGRHLRLRELLFMKAQNDKDHRGALTILKDLDNLLGLYPKGRGAAGKEPDPFLDAGREASISLHDRLVHLLAAEQRGDATGVKLLEGGMPKRFYRLADTVLPKLHLNALCSCYLLEQLNQILLWQRALWNAQRQSDLKHLWKLSAQLCAYRFRIGVDGWRQFTESIGVDGNYLVRCNGQGTSMMDQQERIYESVLPYQELEATLKGARIRVPRLATAKDLEKRWRRAFEAVDAA